MWGYAAFLWISMMVNSFFGQNKTFEDEALGTCDGYFSL